MANNLEKQREIRYEFFFGKPVYLLIYSRSDRELG
jgi:hypothetical protein